jgi:hypothetical protein
MELFLGPIQNSNGTFLTHEDADENQLSPLIVCRYGSRLLLQLSREDNQSGIELHYRTSTTTQLR